MRLKRRERSDSNTFSYDFSTPGTPEEAQYRLQRVLTERLQRPSGGGAATNLHRAMRLSKKSESSLSYGPKLQVPMPVSTLVWLGRLLKGEKVLVTFTPEGADRGGTHVVVSGKMGHGGEAVADPEFWDAALSDS
jgi:hypothetical protein